MAQLIDLTLLKESQQMLQKLLAKRGLTYFLDKEGGGNRLFSLEKSKVDLVHSWHISTLMLAIPPTMQSISIKQGSHYLMRLTIAKINMQRFVKLS